MAYGANSADRSGITLSISADPARWITTSNHRTEVDNSRHGPVHKVEIHSFDVGNLLLLDQSQDSIIRYNRIRSTVRRSDSVVITNGNGSSGDSTSILSTVIFFDSTQCVMPTVASVNMSFIGGKETVSTDYELDIP